MEGRRKDIAKAIGQVEQGQGVIVLTDLFGGTPSNLAISLLKGENVEVIAASTCRCSSGWRALAK